MLLVIDILPVVIFVYLILHIPAFIMLVIGFFTLKKKPQTAKILFIIAGVYFLIGGGICGSMFV